MNKSLEPVILLLNNAYFRPLQFLFLVEGSNYEARAAALEKGDGVPDIGKASENRAIMVRTRGLYKACWHTFKL